MTVVSRLNVKAILPFLKNIQIKKKVHFSGIASLPAHLRVPTLEFTAMQRRAAASSGLARENGLASIRVTLTRAK